MYLDKKVFAIIVAAGKGTRIGFDKMLYRIDGTPVVEKSIAAFQNNSLVDGIVAVAGDNINEIGEICKKYSKVIAVVKGGSQRAESVANGLAAIETDGLVAVHDGARPFVADSIITDTIKAAYATNASIPCVPVKDTIKMGADNVVEKSLPREKLYITQTPQVFDIGIYKQLLAADSDFSVTDDAQLFERAGYQVVICQGSYENYKITTIDDIKKETKMSNKNTIVISAFPACGKSWCFDNLKNKYDMSDSDSSNYSWIRTIDEKGNEVKVRNPDFPQNYIDHIKSLLGVKDFIFVSSHDVVRNALKEANIPYFLVYPDNTSDNKCVWTARMFNRESPISMIDFIQENWDEFIEQMKMEEFPFHYILINKI